MFAIMFFMYGLGFFYGGKLIADSRVESIADFPIPADFMTAPKWAKNKALSDVYCGKPASRKLLNNTFQKKNYLLHV